MITAAEFLKWLNVFGIAEGATGTVTSITAGTGLTGGTITTSGTIALAVPVTVAHGGTGLTSASVNGLYYASAANVIGQVVPVDNAVLTTSGGGVPSLTTVLPSGLTIPGYLALSGGVMTGELNMNNQVLTNVLYPSANQDAASKIYVDTVAAGLAPAGAVDASTTANFPATYYNGSNNDGVGATLTATSTGTVTFDGQLTVLGNDYLFKNQTDQTQNGIYTATTAGAVGVNAVFTRNVHYDTPEAINNTGIVPVINGSTQGGQGYYQTSDVSAIGTTPIVYVNFGNTGTVTSITAGTGLTGGTITSSGTIALIIPVAVTNGGTGLTGVSANGVLYATASNTVGQTTQVNSAVMISSAGGVPSFSTTLPSGLTIPGYGSGSVTSISAGSGTTFSTITTTGSVSANQQNLIIGGNFDTNPWQRGTSFTGVTQPSAVYTADRFAFNTNASGVVTVQQSSDSPSISQSGILTSTCFNVTVTTAEASLGSSDFYYIRYRMEGYDFQPIAQQAFTLSFWVKATVTGVYSLAVGNNADRTYVTTFTVNTTNTWQFVSVTIPASPSAGTWNYTNGTGLQITWCLGSGSSFFATLNTWNSNIDFAASSQVNAIATIGNIFELQLVKCEPGSVATRWVSRPIQKELSLCQRYYYKSFPQGVAPVQNSGTTAGAIGYYATLSGANNTSVWAKWPVTMRATPTVVFYSPLSNTADWYNVTNSANSGAGGAALVGDNGATLLNGQASGDNASNAIAVHITASAEL